jgi:hypothetical protein
MPYDITEKAMLASLHIKQWAARKHDKAVSREVNTHYGSQADAGRFNKVLATKEALKDIQTVVSAARGFHLEQTLPWGERGERLLPSRNYGDYSRRMREFSRDFDRAVEAFVRDYPVVIFEARNVLGGLFNRDDYPQPSEIRDKFALRTVINPVPLAEDFRVRLAEDEVAAIQADIAERLRASQAAATRDVWQRLYTVVAHMVERLSDPEAVFRDTLVGNIVQLTELVPKLNITDDPQLEAFRRSIQESLCRLEPEILRRDPQSRRETADAARQVLDAMGGYMEAA